MSFLRDVPIRFKVLAPPIILALALVIVLTLGVYTSNVQQSALDQIQTIVLGRISEIDAFVILGEQVQSDVYQVSVLRMMNVPEEEAQAIQAQLELGLNDLNVMYRQILARWDLDETEANILARMKTPLETCRQQALQASAVVVENPSFGAVMVRASTTAFEDLKAILYESRDYQSAKIAEIERATQERAQAINRSLTVVVIVVTLLSILAAGLVSSLQIARPVREITGLMRRLADGDLSVEVGEVERQDEIGEMARAVEVFRLNAIEKERAERALRASEENYRAIFNAVNDAIFIHDMETGDILDVNQRMCEMYGYTREEARRISVETVSAGEPPYSQQEAVQWIKKAAEGEPQLFDWRCKDKAGRLFWVEVNLRRAAIGGQDRVLALVRDITARKQAEKEVENALDMLHDSQEAASIGTWWVTMPDLGMRWTPEVFRTFGLKPGHGEPTFEEFFAFVHPDDLDFVQQRAREQLAKFDGAIRYTYRIQLPNGEIKSLEQIGRQVRNADDFIIRVIGTIQDITERVRAEQALQAYSERLEEMVQARTRALEKAQEQLVRREKLAVLGQLAGGVSHELRNPLAAIKNAVYFLNMVLEDPDVETREMLEVLDKEVGTAEKIISSLLDFARTKAPIRHKVGLNDVIQAVLSRTAVPDAPRVEVVLQLDEDLPSILADPDQLAQVFGNLIHNGIQAMAEGGRLVVRTAVESPQWVTVSIADAGMGISEKNLGKIFEPLFTTKAKGIGLGLALVKTLVEGHGGSIEVQSEEGKGSTFTVRLPVNVTELSTE